MSPFDKRSQQFSRSFQPHPLPFLVSIALCSQISVDKQETECYVEKWALMWPCIKVLQIYVMLILKAENNDYNLLIFKFLLIKDNALNLRCTSAGSLLSRVSLENPK